MKQEKIDKKVIAIVGPTASGKTSLAVEIAKLLDTEIISADSRQIFKEFNIAVAKPSQEEMQDVKHNLIGIINPDEEYTVANFADDAKKIMQNLYSKNKIPVVVGGTGLYFRILLENFDIPKVPPNKELREKLHDIAQKQGNEAVHKILYELDEKLAKDMHPNNIVKIIRAIEVSKMLGIPMSEAQKIKKEPEFDVLWIGLGHLNGDERQFLYDRTDARVDTMLKNGLESEARRLFEKYGKISSLMHTIGYQEFEEYFENKISYEKAIEKIKQNTRRYAKRQLTWFRKNEHIHWLDIKNKTKKELTTECIEIIQNKWNIVVKSE